MVFSSICGIMGQYIKIGCNCFHILSNASLNGHILHHYKTGGKGQHLGLTSLTTLSKWPSAFPGIQTDRKLLVIGLLFHLMLVSPNKLKRNLGEGMHLLKNGIK
jgi:hypothetical protein